MTANLLNAGVVTLGTSNPVILGILFLISVSFASH